MLTHLFNESHKAAWEMFSLQQGIVQPEILSFPINMLGGIAYAFILEDVPSGLWTKTQEQRQEPIFMPLWEELECEMDEAPLKQDCEWMLWGEDSTWLLNATVLYRLSENLSINNTNNKYIHKLHWSNFPKISCIDRYSLCIT